MNSIVRFCDEHRGQRLQTSIPGPNRVGGVFILEATVLMVLAMFVRNLIG